MEYYKNKHFLIGQTINLQKWWDAKIEPKIKNLNSGLLLVIASIWLVYVLFIFLLAVFIEVPIRMIISTGNIKDKIRYWFSMWKGVYSAFGGEIK